jgi:hypothetical protein
MNFNGKIEALSCNYFCSWKSLSMTYSECVLVAYVIQHEMCTRHIVMCSITRSTLFFSIMSYIVRFSTNGFRNEMWVTIFCKMPFRNFFHYGQNWARYDQKCIFVFMQMTAILVLVKPNFNFLDIFSKST